MTHFNENIRKSRLSFTFEFKSPIRRRDIASKLSKNLGKKIKWFKGVNESFKASDSLYKLSNKYSEHSKTFIFETGFMKYEDGIHCMLKTMNLVEYFGFTCDRCEMKVNIKLNEDSSNSVKINNLNKFKYLIGLDENKLLDLWNTESNERQKLYYDQHMYISTKNPYSTFMTSKLVENMDPNFFNFPSSEFFGHNFSKLNEGYLQINYIGGKDYHKRKKEAKETIDLVIARIHETLTDNYGYSVEEKRKIEKIVEEYRESVDSTKSYSKFKKKYPNVKIYYDLSESEFRIDSNFNNIREKLFQLVVFGKVEEALINYDNERKVFQVKDAKIDQNIIVEGIEFYNCQINADAKGCLFENCTIRNSKLEGCDILTSNYIKNSRILDCTYHGGGNDIVNSYIDNKNESKIDADVRKSIIANGKFKMSSTIDKETKFFNL